MNNEQDGPVFNITKSSIAELFHFPTSPWPTCQNTAPALVSKNLAYRLNPSQQTKAWTFIMSWRCHKPLEFFHSWCPPWPNNWTEPILIENTINCFYCCTTTFGITISTARLSTTQPLPQPLCYVVSNVLITGPIIGMAIISLLIFWYRQYGKRMTFMSSTSHPISQL